MAGVEVQEGVMEENTSSPKPNSRAKSGSRKKATPPVTVPQPFNLGLTKRVEERQQYRAEMARKQKQAEDRERQRREEEEEEERRALKEYRKTLDFKANPIQKFPHITINPSSKELTTPTAPRLSTSQRRRKTSDGDGSMDERAIQMSSNSPLPRASEAAPA